MLSHYRREMREGTLKGIGIFQKRHGKDFMSTENEKINRWGCLTLRSFSIAKEFLKGKYS